MQVNVQVGGGTEVLDEGDRAGGGRIQVNGRHPQKLNTPVTFGYCPDDPAPGCNDVFFRLDGNPANARFVLTYRDQEFAVANINSLSSGPGNAPQKDHTIEVLSVLHQLVNLNKCAADIRATPSVQVLP